MPPAPSSTALAGRRYTADNVCKECGLQFPSRTRILYHLRVAHEPRSQCPDCGKQVLNLRNHLRIHSEVKGYLCELCSRTFSCHQNLKYHYKSHHASELNIPRATCDYCGKDFPDKYYLQKHIRCIHIKDYDFVCDNCGLGFTQKSNYELHLKIHRGEKQQCKQCEKFFSNAFSLQRHERIHTGERPYKCRFCDKRFACSGDRRMHEDIHGNEYRHKCKVCNQRFVIYSSSLCPFLPALLYTLSHLLTHTQVTGSGTVTTGGGASRGPPEQLLAPTWALVVPAYLNCLNHLSGPIRTNRKEPCNQSTHKHASIPHNCPVESKCSMSTCIVAFSLWPHPVNCANLPKYELLITCRSGGPLLYYHSLSSL